MRGHRPLAFLLLAAATPQAQETPAPRCDDVELYHQLDFWLGEWDVYVGDSLVGRNRIEKILDGCAVIENWSSTAGGEGKSLFFIDYDGHWAQIWVTAMAMMPGGVKEKVMVDDPPAGTIRFQGVVRHPEAGAWVDRTTLTPLGNGAVRQLIEVSKDRGETWNPTFDAIYRPAADQ